MAVTTTLLEACLSAAPLLEVVARFNDINSTNATLFNSPVLKANTPLFCALYQSGASGTADRAAELLQGLVDNGKSNLPLLSSETSSNNHRTLSMRLKSDRAG